MTNRRSPNYPAMGLPDALSEVQKIWNEEQRTPVTIEALATAMGYKSLSGPVRTKIAALRKYGLLDQNGGRYSLSDLAMTILHGQPDERNRALAIAASKPDLFREFFETHPNASDAALNSELVLRRAFSQAGANQFIKAFRDTLSIADPSKSGYSRAKDVEVPESMANVGTQEQARNTPVPSQAGSTTHSNSWTWTLSIPRNVRAELKIAGDVTRDDVRRLKKQIEFLEESFEDEVSESERALRELSPK